MRQPNNEYGKSSQAWLPSQNWQEIAKKRQEKIAVAEAERTYRNQIFRRRVFLSLFVLGTTGIVAPAVIYPKFAQADQIDASMGYTRAESTRMTFGGRLENAEPIISDGSELLAGGTVVPEQEPDPAQEGPQDFVAFGEDNTTPTEEVVNSQAYAAIGDAAPGAQPQDQPVQPNQQLPADATGAYAFSPDVTTITATSDDVLQTPAEEPASGQMATEAVSYPVPAASTDEPSWWSVPSWNSASAPQYDAIGIWDTHYYIAHNWTSYGEVILRLQNGDTLSIDGQRLMVTDSAYFYAGTDYETVRARFGWDSWCMQTCYGDTQVRVVSFVPIS